MKCYRVICKDNAGNIYSVGVVAVNEEYAKSGVINALLEGKHVVANVVSVIETNEI